MQTNSLYWFTLTTRATSSSQKPLGNPLSNQTRLQTPHTKVVTLNPSRNTLPLANHTKSIDLEHLKNTQHSLAIQQQKYKRLRKDYTWSKFNWKEYNCNPIPLSLENPKLDVNLENLRSNLSNWISQNCFLPFKNI